ncbi:hypothetical protein L1049_023942 [Liquidambar formosana]|uniref:Uncharacterized protein n=1 Tax=Liquidambar formosana TaxID=63359 RepID=A0AAP0S135_LIQFO
MEDQYLFQPLVPIPTTTTTTSTSNSLNEIDGDNTKLSSSNSAILLRLLSILFIGILSIWADHEASKGFRLSILNDAKHSPAGRRFKLLYVSNDEATRIVLNTSRFVEKLLYPDKNHPKKEVSHVTLRLACRNLTHPVIVDPGENHVFVMHISPSVMKESNVNYAMLSAVQRGMARVWLWDDGGEHSAPPSLVDGMVEYISILAGFGRELNPGGAGGSAESGNYSCWKDKDPVAVAHFLHYCEGQKKGFIQRLNQGMRRRWHEWMVDDALGLPVEQLCASYNGPKKHQSGRAFMVR